MVEYQFKVRNSPKFDCNTSIYIYMCVCITKLLTNHRIPQVLVWLNTLEYSQQLFMTLRQGLPHTLCVIIVWVESFHHIQELR